MRRRRMTRMLATAGTVAAAVVGGGATGAAAQPAPRTDAAILRQAGDGWTLLAPDGAVLFEAHGRAARDMCLRQARELGTLRILS